MKRTKVEILTDRMQEAYDTYRALEAGLSSSKATKCHVDHCPSCGAVLQNMYDFDAHYLVDDERYLNIGNCPTRYNNGKLMPALNVWGKSLEEQAHKENEKYDLINEYRGTDFWGGPANLI